MASLPQGTITFMLTDLQGSTRAWESQPQAMRSAMARHDALLAGAVRQHAGLVVEAGREGDSVLAVFQTAAAAAECALDIQKRFVTEAWPEGLELRVRIALHTGEAQLREGHYFGPALNRCARLLATAHPGQTVLTRATEEVLADELSAEATLKDLGLHRLKDLERPEHVFQLTDLKRPTNFPPLLSLAPRLTNMPRHLSSFVGRGAELSALRSVLRNSRMVTLTGAGGCGKTRLAAELGLACISHWPGGVWWVELGEVRDPLQVPGAVVAALELPGQGSTLDVAIAWLAARRAVLALDSCEHLVAACAEFCEASLEGCPELTIIATSREALGVPGEVRWPVPPLAGSEAVQLFEARAGLVVPGFKLGSGNLATVTQICAHLDGMPLAIELAAARMGMMSSQEILGQLADRFPLLTGGSRTVPQRLQSMTATIDWSYRLLTEDEALLFRRLSVFRGGFTLESAEGVCGEEPAGGILDLLSGLVQKSMVVAEMTEDSGTRYRLLESHHAYAAQRLREAGDDMDVVEGRHYEYFVARLRSDAATQQKWKARETANLWAALRWARDHIEDKGLALAVEVADFEFTDNSKAKALLLDLLEHSPAKGAVRARALNLAARIVSMEGDYDASRALADQSVTLARELNDPALTAYIVNGAGMIHQARGELELAEQRYDEALSLLKNSKHPGNRALAIEVENCLGLLAVERGDHAAAREILARCVEQSRKEGDEASVARHLESLANAQLGLGDVDGAWASWTGALSTYRHLKDPFGPIWCLGGLALAASARGDHKRALRLAAVADRMSHEWSLSTGSSRMGQIDAARALAHASLGERVGAATWGEGQAMTTQRALEYALSDDASGTVKPADAGPLSRREREVVRLVAAGMTNREIAERLFIAERSAEGHIERISNKLGVHSRTEVATWAVEHGLMTAEVKEKGTRAGSLSGLRRKPS